MSGIKTIVVAYSRDNFIFSFTKGDFNIGEWKGKGINIKKYISENDFIKGLFLALRHDDLLLFSNSGKAYKVQAGKVREVIEGDPSASAQHIRELLGLKEEEFPDSEKIINIFRINEKIYSEYPSIIFSTRNGMVKKMSTAFLRNLSNKGTKVITMEGNDSMVWANLLKVEDEVFLTSSSGHFVRFNSEDLRDIEGKEAMGVKGISLLDDKGVQSFHLVSASCLSEGKEIFIVTRKGKSKYSMHRGFRKTARGVRGVYTYKFNEKYGELLTCFAIEIFNTSEFLFLTTSEGKVVRMRVDAISERKNRASGGVSIIKLNKDKKEEVIHCFKFLETLNN